MTDGRHLPRSGLTTPGRTSFKGPVRQGEDTGIPGTVTLGEAVFTQRAEISAAETSATTVFVLPSDHQGGAVRSDIISIEVLTDVIWETSASAVLELTLGSAAGTAIREIGLSAAGQVTLTPSGSADVAWAVGGSAGGGLAGQAIFAKVSAAGTAPDTGHAWITMQYVPR
jgi:hypothetical protein